MARARYIELAGVLTKARTKLAWDKDTPHHIALGDLTVRITADAPEDQVLSLANDARERCPVCNILTAAAKLTVAITVVRQGTVDL